MALPFSFSLIMNCLHPMTNDYYESEAHQDLSLRTSVSDLGMLRNDTHIFDFCLSKIAYKVEISTICSFMPKKLAYLTIILYITCIFKGWF